MFKLRREQKERFVAEEVRDFEERAVLHVQRCFPERWGALGEVGVRALIRRGIERAAGYGIVAERDVCKFVDLAIVFGAGFDRERGWAAEILGAEAPREPSARVHLLYSRALEEA